MMAVLERSIGLSRIVLSSVKRNWKDSEDLNKKRALAAINWTAGRICKKNDSHLHLLCKVYVELR